MIAEEKRSESGREEEVEKVGRKAFEGACCSHGRLLADGVSLGELGSPID